MTWLPETLARHWACIRPMMDAGALLLRNPEDDLFYVDRAWPGIPERYVETLARLNVVRPIGRAYAVAPLREGERTPLTGTYPAITLHQPWASLVAGWAKPWELRDFLPPKKYIGRRVAIHAGVHALGQRHIIVLLTRLTTRRATTTGLDPALAVPILERMLDRRSEIVKGAVVCTAVLGAALPSEALMGQLRAIEAAPAPTDGVALGRWAWPLTKMEPLPCPVPIRGKQGWWKWTPE